MWWKDNHALLSNMKHGSHSYSVLPAQHCNSRKNLMRREVATWWIICSVKSWNKWIILFLAVRLFLKKRKKKKYHTAKCVRQMWLEKLPEVPAGFILAFLERLKTRMAALNLIYVISCLLALLTGHLLSTLLCPSCWFWVFSFNFPSILLIFNTHFSWKDTKILSCCFNNLAPITLLLTKDRQQFMVKCKGKCLTHFEIDFWQ